MTVINYTRKILRTEWGLLCINPGADLTEWIARAFTKDIANGISLKTDNWKPFAEKRLMWLFLWGKNLIAEN